METHPLEVWMRQQYWNRLLATNIHDLLEPGTNTAIQHPHLHEVFANRLEQAWAERRDAEVSRCTEVFEFSDGGKDRADAHVFQVHLNNHRFPERGGDENTAAYRFQYMCPVLKDRMQVYATIGGGAYGTVFLARQPRETQEQDPEEPVRYNYYAIKVEPHWNMENRVQRHKYPTMTVLEEDSDHNYRYIPYEALLLMLVSNSDRFPTLDSVYVDDELHSTVMSACIDHDLLRIAPEDLPMDLAENVKELKRVVAFTGQHLTYEKEPILNELEACKVASQMLEGIAYLRHMNISYGDLSKANFLIDENLNTKLIDLGMTTFGFNDFDFKRYYWPHLNAQEHILTPEMALELSKPRWKAQDRDQRQTQVDVYIPHDTRTAHLWRLSALTYEMLHGFAPWETPQWDDNLNRIDHSARVNDAQWDAVYERRDRMINEEMPVREDLSQDCVDMLRMTLQKRPRDRATLEEMCAIPWFGQWAYRTDVLWVRPESDSYDSKRMGNRLPAWMIV